MVRRDDANAERVEVVSSGRPVTLVRVGRGADVLCRRGSRAEALLRASVPEEKPTRSGWVDELKWPAGFGLAGLIGSVLVVRILGLDDPVAFWVVWAVVAVFAAYGGWWIGQVVETALDERQRLELKGQYDLAAVKAARVLDRVESGDVVSLRTSPRPVWQLYLQARGMMLALQPGWDGHPDAVIAAHGDLYQATLDEVFVAQAAARRVDELIRACEETAGVVGDADVDELARLLDQAHERYAASSGRVGALVGEIARRITVREAEDVQERELEARARAAGLRRRIEMDED